MRYNVSLSKKYLDMNEAKNFETRFMVANLVGNAKFIKKYKPSNVAGYDLTLYNDEISSNFPNMVKVRAIADVSKTIGGYALFIGSDNDSVVDVVLNFDDKKGFTGCEIVETDMLKRYEKPQVKVIKTIAKDLLAMLKERVVVEGSWPKTAYISIEMKNKAKGKFHGDIEVPNDTRGFKRIGEILSNSAYAVRISEIED